MNQLNFKDYAPYYIGCKCFNTWFPKGADMYDNDWVLKGYHAGYPKPYCLDNKEEETWTDSIKPILRKKEDWTSVEYNEYIKLLGKTTDGVHAVIMSYDTPESFNYLLKQGFDIFGLIDAGLAIDSKTLK